MEGAELAEKILFTWLKLVLGLILLPSAFGVSLGISEIYMKILVKTLEWATIRIEKGVPKESGLKNSASVGKSSFSFTIVNVSKLDKFTSTQFELDICRK